MQGTPSEPGIVPLAIQDVFNYIKNNGSVDDREYLLRVSYMEIYNEQICDLLVPSQGVDSARFGGFVASAPTAIRIFESKSQGVIVRGLKEEVVTSTKQVMAFIEAGDSQRRTGSTEMNAHSSRSHSICRLIIESKARKSRGRRFRDAGDSGSVISESTTTTEINNSPVRISTLNLVDLAGSECAKLTNATGVRKKEGQYINKSLMTLGLCIWKLSEASIRAESSIEGKSPKKSPKSSLDNVDHIPYRDSKLTRLLQPSLSGNAQICIICTVTPSMRHLEESLNTLKFAARAKKITQKAEITECVDDKTLINTYRSEISELKRQLKEMSEDRETLHVPKAIQPSQNVIIEENDCDDVNDEETEALRLAIGNLEKLILKNAVKKDDSSSSSISDEESVLLVSRRTQESLLIDTEISDSNVLLQGSTTSENDSRALNVKKNDGRNSPSSELGRASPKKKDDVSVTSDSSGLVGELHRIQGLLGNVLSKKKKTLPKVVIVNTMSPSTSNIESEVEQLKAQLRDQEVATSLSQADSTFLQSQLVEKDNLLGEVSMVLDNVTKRQVQLEQENFLLRQENTRLKSELTRTKGEGKLRQREIENLKKKQNADDEMFSSLI
uniref:Kinesin-like protein n=1 Tax=Proboscia inermis TaxID=420281 RepID=A0A7S0C7P9_9STRA|mmetsp:Transcript_31659/g.31883  ORF Transcript_31659/g.31883 Transcript_31659/m.31883 type:complete len:613 (+) Transcript_31659:2-1840(+)